ncbi:hypothetical protein [Chryseobacterium sp. R2A-55]|uniref:hypothetical protein n=1 Tax=Chryseobacterium sp. R2A-55 TaxID=2744445 RepID=UPI001F39941C|nr:hypothetical protein [Chryseobacterium sp. R2A-55]
MDVFFDQANRFLLFGLVFVIIGYFLNRKNRKPNYGVKRKKIQDYFKDGFKIIFYVQIKFILITGIVFIIVAVIYYFKYYSG